MPKRTFEFVPDLDGNSAKHKFAVRTVKFGDGYEQRQALSLRPKMRTWELQKTGEKEEIDAIEAFIASTNGVESFHWTPPGGEKLPVKVGEEYTVKNIGGLYRISWQFEEVLA